MSGITAHMIVKNEDQWVYYAVKSVLPYVDKFLVADTGSRDQTLKILESFKDPKLVVSKIKASSASEITKVRESQLDKTKTDWCWIVDGDEIYSNSLVTEILTAVKSNKYEGIVVRRHDLLGDIYHEQLESVGSYSLFGQSGHLVTRLVNKKKISGLHYQGNYPLEGFYDGSGISSRARDPRDWYITRGVLYHAMYLKRSSLGGNLFSMINRSKYKIEKGIKLNDQIPEVFSEPHPDFVPNPLITRSMYYQALASLITPIKNIKRKYL